VFTGIIEQTGIVSNLKQSGSNLIITVHSSFANELKVDQSVSHNGVCLTVTEIFPEKNLYNVTAIDETLKRTNLKFLKANNKINLERGMLMTTRLDGHIVQGHVDATAVCTKIENKNGSHIFYFENDGSYKNLLVEKGSVTVNGVSLTVVHAQDTLFTVAIIPYTFLHTTFNFLKTGDVVNVEFDIIGKYVARLMGNGGNR
jgi:riboflavin synthase